MKTLSPAELQALNAQVQPQPSTVSPLLILFLAAFGYGGYRVYKHFKKG